MIINDNNFSQKPLQVEPNTPPALVWQKMSKIDRIPTSSSTGNLFSPDLNKLILPLSKI